MMTLVHEDADLPPAASGYAFRDAHYDKSWLATTANIIEDDSISIPIHRSN